jgi:hypothetical protein
MSTGPLQFMVEKSLSGRDHNGEKLKGKDNDREQLKGKDTDGE